MKYTGALAKTEREQIFSLFLHAEALRFSEIEKQLGLRSNMVSYHLEQLQKDGVVEKAGEEYHLTRQAETYIPLLPQVTGKELSPLPVVLVACMHEEKVLLIKREKRPYKGWWSLLGGKWLFGEGIADAATRVVLEKSGVVASFRSSNGVVAEKVVDAGNVKHHFLLFFAKAVAETERVMDKGHGLVQWYDLAALDYLQIIPSDKWLLQHALEKVVPLPEETLAEDDNLRLEFS